MLTLPNEYELENRIKMVRGLPISKYGLTPDPPGDRHRWFFALDDARRFVYTNAERHGWTVQDERAFIGARPGESRGAPGAALAEAPERDVPGPPDQGLTSAA